MPRGLADAEYAALRVFHGGVVVIAVYSIERGVGSQVDSEERVTGINLTQQEFSWGYDIYNTV